MLGKIVLWAGVLVLVSCGGSEPANQTNPVKHAEILKTCVVVDKNCESNQVVLDSSGPTQVEFTYAPSSSGTLEEAFTSLYIGGGVEKPKLTFQWVTLKADASTASETNFEMNQETRIEVEGGTKYVLRVSMSGAPCLEGPTYGFALRFIPK